MARLTRLCLPGIPQHIIQRGANRQACFASEEDFAAYAHWLAESAGNNHVAIHAWVFMTNHVHLLVTPESKESLSRMMQMLGRHMSVISTTSIVEQTPCGKVVSNPALSMKKNTCWFVSAI